ncbi:MAG: Na+/H+ antiporter NhaC family protein, partial [Clostridia bacterium]|nr:Na+/H+ antiporter NhaC family protein [Clostridia bacterium]
MTQFFIRRCYTMDFYATIFSLLPPIIAIALALITKEVYSSLFVGILAGGLLFSGFNLVGTMEHVFVDGMIGTALADTWNVGILIFLVVLGGMVMLMNRAGGSAAFGRWSVAHVKTKVGAQICTIILGVLIFIDDYFNCLTVGSVMRPLTDKHGISRAKLAYLIDATAAPVCIIAPISSWAAAVTGFVDGANGLELFIKAIPYNFYAILTIVMMLTLTFAKFEYGPMRLAEMAQHLDENHAARSASITGAEDQPEPPVSAKGKVIHLVFPIIVLIISCVIGMIYTGGFFDGASFIDAFSGSDASVGLVFGSVVAMIITIIFYLITGVLNFKECMNAIPEGFKSMVPAILILTFAWTLKAMTDSLGAAEYVAGLVEQSAGSFMNFLPAIIFLIACGLSFATGTSWGTFGILIPIVVDVFNANMGNELRIIAISACMAGAVCGDHCSPISDTTLMASA